MKKEKGKKKKDALLPNWDLSDLYAGIQDPEVKKDAQNVREQARAFEEKYREKVTEALGAVDLLKVIQEYERILQETVKPLMYGEMVASTHADDSSYGAFLQEARTLFADVNRHVIFFEVALSKLSEAKLREWVSDPILQNYRHYLERQIAWKTHRLSEAEEKVMSDKSLTGRSAFVRLFEEQLARKEFLVGKKKLNEAQALDLLYSSKRGERKAAALGLTQAFQELSERTMFIYNMVLQDKATDDRYRKFSDPEAERHLANEVDRSVVDTAVGVVVGNYGLVQDYYRFKRRALKYKTLYDFDRYAPLGKQQQRFSFHTAHDIILYAFRDFSPEFAQEAEKFFVGSWIDVSPRRGKRGGAYCQYVTPDKHPYVFMNYTGKAREVMTLAHELGHGVNALLARQQTFLNFDWPLTIAETASVFGEMLVFDYLKKIVKNDGERLALLSQRIEDAFATVFRQITMFRFERLAHASRAKGELLPDELGELWLKTQKEMFGNMLTFSKGYDVWWSYIPHFFYTPFYVYSYAFGQLLSMALYAQYQQHGQAMVAAYLHFLRAGGSKSPDALLSELGVDWSTPEFWQSGIDQMKEWVKEVKRLA